MAYSQVLFLLYRFSIISSRLFVSCLCLQSPVSSSRSDPYHFSCYRSVISIKYSSRSLLLILPLLVFSLPPLRYFISIACILLFYCFKSIQLPYFKFGLNIVFTQLVSCLRLFFWWKQCLMSVVVLLHFLLCYLYFY